MKKILDKVDEIVDVLNDEHGVPNISWVTRSVNELQKMIAEKHSQETTRGAADGGRSEELFCPEHEPKVRYDW